MTIDVWNAATFDAELLDLLRGNAELIRQHVKTENANFLKYDLNNGPNRPLRRPDNLFFGGFLRLQEDLGEYMQRRTIRAWHYTRMTDDEVTVLRRDGMHLSTPDTLRERLDRLAASGAVGSECANQLFERSPIHGDQREARAGKVWFVSHPIAVRDSRVTGLLRYWGGEVVSFWADDAALLEPIEKAGRGRVLEVGVPLAVTKHSFTAAGAVLATYARAIEGVEGANAFDLCAIEPIPGSSVLRVNTEGDGAYEAIGDSYPADFVDVD